MCFSATSCGRCSATSTGWESASCMWHCPCVQRGWPTCTNSHDEAGDAVSSLSGISQPTLNLANGLLPSTNSRSWRNMEESIVDAFDCSVFRIMVNHVERLRLLRIERELPTIHFSFF